MASLVVKGKLDKISRSLSKYYENDCSQVWVARQIQYVDNIDVDVDGVCNTFPQQSVVQLEVNEKVVQKYIN